MLGSEFVTTYASKGNSAWEAAALSLAQKGEATPWPFVELNLQDGENRATVRVQSDVFSIGPLGDHVRIPLRPGTAQDIANTFGFLLPTPWLTYKIWQAAFKLSPVSAGAMGEVNRGADLKQYAKHSAVIDQQIRNASIPDGRLVAGIKKHVVVSNIYQAGKVLIFGWYRPSPPFPDVFDDHQSMESNTRQPIQPKSNVHGAGYVDYSHGIQFLQPECIVNGQPSSLLALYQHPTLSKLVSNEGPVRFPRYPSAVAAPTAGLASTGVTFESTTPTSADRGLVVLAELQNRGKK